MVSRDGFGSPVPRQPAHLHTQAESGAYLRDLSRVPRRRTFIYLKPPYAIGSVPSLSGHHAISYRWRSLPRVRRHRASKPQGSSGRVLPWQVTMDHLICASLSHTHYWYEVGMLKVPVQCRLLLKELHLPAICPGGSVRNLETLWRWDVGSILGAVTRTGIFPHKIRRKKKNAQVENDYFVGTQNSSSRSTREKDGWILLAIKIKASTFEGRWRNSVWPSSYYVTFLLLCDPGWCIHKPSVTSRTNGMTTQHIHAYDQQYLYWIGRITRRLFFCLVIGKRHKAGWWCNSYNIAHCHPIAPIISN